MMAGHRPYSHLDNDDDIFLHRRKKKIHRKKLHRCLLGTVACLSVLLVVAVLAAVQVAISSPRSTPNVPVRRESSAAFEDALVVRTNCEEYVGTIEDGAFVFKGVPYAKAPVGHLRWKKPIAWWADGQWCGRGGRRRAHRYARPCAHSDPVTPHHIQGSEDCLFLNVWSPRLDTSAGLEVFVWVHGGFLQWGSGHEAGICPSGRVAKSLNAVFVSFNYRLGAFGFMALDMLSRSPQDARGNYGLWDQLVALQWVKHNIRAFGGDPEKVTVFGADSGAASILALRSSEIAKGLFQRSWLLGPSVTFNRTFDDLAMRNHGSFLARSGCTNDTCLRLLTTKQVVDAYLGADEPSFRIRDQNDLPIQGMYTEQLIVVDGEILMKPPLETLLEGEGTVMPTLVGTTSSATDSWPGPDDLFEWSWTQLVKYVRTSMGSFEKGLGDRVLQHYNASHANDFWSAEEAYSSMVTDLRQTCPVDMLCRELANVSDKAPIWRYVVTAKPSAPIKTLGYPSSLAFHPWDAIAFFDHMEHFLDSVSLSDLNFRDDIQRLVRAFVRSSQTSAVHGWQPFPANLALISKDNVTLTPNYHRDQCEFWRERGFDDYAWVS